MGLVTDLYVAVANKPSRRDRTRYIVLSALRSMARLMALPVNKPVSDDFPFSVIFIMLVTFENMGISLFHKLPDRHISNALGLTFILGYSFAVCTIAYFVRKAALRLIDWLDLKIDVMQMHISSSNSNKPKIDMLFKALDESKVVGVKVLRARREIMGSVFLFELLQWGGHEWRLHCMNDNSKRCEFWFHNRESSELTFTFMLIFDHPASLLDLEAALKSNVSNLLKHIVVLTEKETASGKQMVSKVKMTVRTPDGYDLELTDMTYETARNIIGWYDVYGRQAKVAADILWLFWKELRKYGTGACVAERTFLSKGDGEFKIAFSVRDMGDV